MLKKILIAVSIILILAAAFVYSRLRPSGDIDNYAEHFVDYSNHPADSTLKVTFFGVSTLLIDDGKTQVLIDGFFSRPSMSKALFTNLTSDTAAIAQIISTYGMSRLKGVFVTHTHYDHSFDAGYVARMTGATLYGSVSTLNVGRGSGVTEDKLEEFQPNKDLALGDLTVRVVPSRHSPGNALKDDGIIISEPLRQPANMKVYVEGGAFDFLITYQGKKIFIKPSPNFIPGALDSLDVDALFLGIATATKQDSVWADQFYRENVLALEPAVLIPIHWDDFFYPVSDHLVMLPRFVANVANDFDYFSRRLKADRIDFKILQGTKSIILFD